MTDAFIEKIKSLSIIVKNEERLPYGKGSRGKFIPPEETGGLAIFVPSFGALEKEEVDYVAEGALEKEKQRQKKKRQSVQKARLEQVSLAMKQAPSGKRAKTGREIIKELGG